MARRPLVIDDSGASKDLDTDLTGRVVEDDRVLAEVIPFGIECATARTSVRPNDLTEWDRDRPRGAVTTSEGLAVMGELD